MDRTPGRWNAGLELCDVIRIAAILRRKLPCDLVPLILDYAETWIRLATSRGSHSYSKTRPSSGRVVLKCTLPRGMPANCVRRVQIRTTSRVYWPPGSPRDQATRRESKVWFQIGIREDGSEPRKSDRVGVDGDEVSRQPIITKLGCNEEWTTHGVIWDAKHEDDEIWKKVRLLRAGDTIELSMSALSLGQMICLVCASIYVEGVAVRRL